MTKTASKYENSCAMYADYRWYVDELTTSRIDSGLKTGVLTVLISNFPAGCCDLIPLANFKARHKHKLFISSLSHDLN